METPAALDTSHPSFGCTSAVFVFRMTPSSGRQRTILVEARNSWAVITIERLSIDGQRVSEFCELMAVVRGFGAVSMRNDDVSEIQFSDFVLDVVDRDRFTNDLGVINCFAKALDQEEKEYVDAKLQAELDAMPKEKPVNRESAFSYVTREVKRIRAMREEKAEEKAEEKRVGATVTSALYGLGFPKKNIDAWALEFDANGLDDGAAVRAGCQALARSPR